MEPLSGSVIVGITEALTGQAIDRMPSGGTTVHADPDVRRAAYVRFQDAASTVQAHMVFVREAASTMTGVKALGARGWALGELGRVSDAMSEFMGAAHELRLVGNHGPREVAENITSLIGELSAAMPPERPQARVNACLKLLGELHKEFTIVARIDLEYDRKVRWWQPHLWGYWLKHRKEPEWPGGWPGPDMTTRLKEIEQNAAGKAVISS